MQVRRSSIRVTTTATTSVASVDNVVVEVVLVATLEMSVENFLVCSPATSDLRFEDWPLSSRCPPTSSSPPNWLSATADSCWVE